MEHKENKATLSVCLIVKDEENMIAGCLESVKSCADEIIIVDTGSKDRTIEIAKGYDCKIFEEEWEDDFSKARNTALSKASSNHILIIDADERLINPEVINNIISTPNSNTGGWLVEVSSEATRLDGGRDIFTSKLLRLFISNEDIKFQGVIHEQVLPSIQSLDLKIVDSTLKFTHLGYALSVDEMKKKHKRNLELLNMAIDDDSQDGYILFQRAKTLLALNNLNEAEKDIQSALEYTKKSSSIYPQTLNYGGIIAFRRGDFNLAITRADESLALIPNQAFANFILGESYSIQKNFPGALKSYKNMLKAEISKEIKPVISGEYCLPKEQLSFRIGRTLISLKLYDEALNEFEKGHAINLRDTGNIVGLANVAFRNNDFKKARMYLETAIEIEPNRGDLKAFLKQLTAAENIKNKPVSTQKQVINNQINGNGKQPFLSLCMIVKDEEKFLEGCLESIKDIADEIVIVDTGSKDRTKDIARSFNAKIYDFPWINDFAAARNESLKHCKGEWILYLDADERMQKESAHKILKLLKSASNKIGGFVVTIESKHLQLDDSIELHRGGYPRIFRNYGYPTIKFTGSVHEQITPTIFALDKLIDFTDLIIEHLGYDISREEMDAKVRRNYSMLIETVKEEPLNSYAWYQLGQTLAQLRLFEESENAIRMALQVGKLSDSVYASATATLAQLVGTKKQFGEALHWADESLGKAPSQVYALHLKAYALLYLDRLKESERVFMEVKKRLKHVAGVPRTGFDIVIPENVVDKGLNEVQKRMNEIA